MDFKMIATVEKLTTQALIFLQKWTSDLLN